MNAKIRRAQKSLKDFQRKTVDYVFRQFYRRGRTKMLVADEVGLGKTIVAKGIIAKAYAKFLSRKDKGSFNVIYVCSNRAIARQNLNKLNFTEDENACDWSSGDDRMTALAYQAPEREKQGGFSIRAFTPATSFDDRTHAGRCDERILLYRLLHDYKDIYPHRNSLKWILKGNYRINEARWSAEIRAAEKGEGRPVRGKVRSSFKAKLEEEVTPDILKKCFEAVGVSHPLRYWTLIVRLCELGFRQNNYSNIRFAKELISHLRLTLSRACVEFLKANIFILDEFQRYKNLIDDDPDDGSPAAQLVRDVFNAPGGKILMLSATPFKAYTNDFDEMNGEIHHKEFEIVLKFLNDKKPAKFWANVRKNRSEFFSLLRHPQDLDSNWQRAVKVKSELERAYRECMVRTERLIVSKDPDAMIQPVSEGVPLEFRSQDIHDFVGLDRVTVHLNEKHGARLPVPVEYVKSSPFALSFLDRYQHRKKLREFFKVDPHLRSLLKQNRHAWVDLQTVARYGELFSSDGEHYPNARLRMLLDNTVSNGGWKLLWIPPALPYYEFDGPYKGMDQYSKVLIFSSWLLVPRMISTMVSYEAERLSVGNPASILSRGKESVEDEDERKYFARRRTPRRQLIFRVDKGKFSHVGSIMYNYPCVSLAQVYDPASNLANKHSPDQIKAYVAGKIKDLLSSEKLKQFCSDKSGDWQKWYWAAPLLFDRVAPFHKIVSEWFESIMWIDEGSGASDPEGEAPGKSRYFEYIRDIFKDPKVAKLPPLNEQQRDEISKHLANMVLGSPAICCLRTLLRYDKLSDTLIDNAFDVASCFISLFNKPESIAIVRLTTRADIYLDKVLEYSIHGNIQAMLDEYVYLIRDLEGANTPGKVTEFLKNSLEIRTAPVFIDGLGSFLSSKNDETDSHRKAIRTHFAADFGGQKLIADKSFARQTNIRQAFNSPFRPFVLATTSVGQEGLDFHLYCRKIFHWNLPSNAIDLEQREGRINRYKGLVIRKNLAGKYAHLLESGGNKTWERLFEIAEKTEGKGVGQFELVPFWHTEPQEGVRIERHVPLYPFSRDIEKYQNLRKILAYYRLTFGQPRQEELITALANPEVKISAEKLKELLINLSPIRFDGKKLKAC